MSTDLLHDSLPHAPQGPLPHDYSDPARTAMPATRVEARNINGADAQAAFWRGVEAGRIEAARRQDAFVVVPEPAATPKERGDLERLLRSVRGVAAVAPCGAVGAGPEIHAAAADVLLELRRAYIAAAAGASRPAVERAVIDRLVVALGEEPPPAAGPVDDAPDSVDPADLPERQCVAVLATDAFGRVLLVRTKRGWEMPGGGVEEGEMPHEAATREVREEAGVELVSVVCLARIAGAPKPGASYRSRITVYAATAEGTPRAGSDAHEAAWWTKDGVVSAHGGCNLSDLASRDVLLRWAQKRG